MALFHFEVADVAFWGASATKAPPRWITNHFEAVEVRRSTDFLQPILFYKVKKFGIPSCIIDSKAHVLYRYNYWFVPLWLFHYCCRYVLFCPEVVGDFPHGKVSLDVSTIEMSGSGVISLMFRHCTYKLWVYILRHGLHMSHHVDYVIDRKCAFCWKLLQLCGVVDGVIEVLPICISNTVR